MNFFDKAISWFAPATGLRRAQARAVLQEITQYQQWYENWSLQRASLAYDAAKPGRRTDGWFRPGTSANAEVGSGLGKLRDGARDLVRNNPLAAKIVLEFANRIVGTQIRPQAKTPKKDVNETLDKTFDIWARQVRYYQLQHLGIRTIVESGEALIRYRVRRPEDGLIVPLFPQLMEPDFIDHSKTENLPNGSYIIQGVEFDAEDREVALWMFGSHPGDVINTAAARRSSYTSYRVPIRTDNPLEGISRGYRQDRPGQVRGVSWLAPVMLALWDLAGYEEAERVRKRIEACLAAFVTSPEAGTNGARVSPGIGPQAKGKAGDLVEEFRPGMIHRLRPGETVTVAEPKAAGGYTEYTRRQDRLISAGVGLLYELTANDLSQVSYSSYRGGLVGLRDFVEILQYDLAIPFACDPTWPRFVDACKIAGIVPIDTPYDVEWCPPAFDLLDRATEAEADEREIRIGTSTWDQAVARRGYDPNKQMAEIATRNKEFDANGIVLDCDPRKTARSGVFQSKPAPQSAQ